MEREAMSSRDSKDEAPEHRRRTWWLLARLRRLSPEVECSWAHAVALIDGLTKKNEQEGLNSEQGKILKTRWVGQAKMYERLWRGQRSLYYLIRVPIIIGATTIPVLASLG